ncbi:ABC transporter substrate-binding protein [Alicyclobacillus fodiniaquatilis]|jgi:multiple sugar transport system substrate-binding protein|uniref:ABC transporter substrate-binding protein n=1 Tax=Alicyclobacillus fodiniaquatilis TaxID=1661150 RepID=A0ABW4JDT6_9BACL
MNKKAISVPLCTVGLLSLISGCGSEQTSSSANHVIQLTAWYVEGSATGDETLKLVKEFNETHKNIHVNATYVASNGQNAQKLIAAIAGGNPPDVAEVDSLTIPEYASKGALVDLAPYAKADGVKKSQYIPAVWDSNSYNGDLYAMPWYTDVRFLFWNKTLFQKAGLNPNDPPKTIAQLDKDAAKLTKVNQQGNITQAGFVPWESQGASYYTWAWAFGANFVNKSGKLNLACPKGVQSFVWQQQFAKKYGISRLNAFVSSVPQSIDPFNAGKLAMEINGEFAIATLRQQAPNLKYGVEPIPTVDGKGTTWSGGISWAVPTGSKHPKAAFEFMKWLNQPKQEMEFNKVSTEYPPLISMVKNLGKPGDIIVNQTVDKLAAKLLPETHTRPVTPFGGELWDDLLQAQSNVTNDQSANPKSVLEAIDNKFNAQQQ